jgi:hypothetical protein
MKLSKLLAMAIMSLMFTGAYALETENEKNEATKNELKRETNKAVNRVKEAVCMDSDTECLKEKVKNRAQEATDAVKDKTTEIKNKVDE